MNQGLEKLEGCYAVAAGLAAAALGMSAAAATSEDSTVPTSLSGLLPSFSGVMGSGDRLSLKLNIDGQRRLLSVGEAYHGWTLRAISPSEATSSQEGTTAKVGLNGTGRLNDAPPSVEETKIIVLLSGEEQALLDRALFMGEWNGRAFSGLSYDQTIKLILANQRIGAAIRAGRQELSVSEMRQIVGGDATYDEILSLSRLRERARSLEQPSSPEAFSGPSTYYVAAGESQRDAATRLGVNMGGVWLGTRDSSGGWIYTRRPAGAGPLSSADEFPLPPMPRPPETRAATAP